MKGLLATLSFNDTQHNDIQLMAFSLKCLFVTFSINDTQHNDIRPEGLTHDIQQMTFCILTFSLIVFSMKCFFASLCFNYTA